MEKFSRDWHDLSGTDDIFLEHFSEINSLWPCDVVW